MSDLPLFGPVVCVLSVVFGVYLCRTRLSLALLFVLSQYGDPDLEVDCRPCHEMAKDGVRGVDTLRRV